MAADSGSIWPAFPLATAAHPVTSTRMSFSISRRVSSMCSRSWGSLGLLQPTTATAPRMVPAAMASTSGFGVPPSAPRSASTENPPIMRTGFTGIRTRSWFRSG